MFFAVFEASDESQEHANQLTRHKADEKETWSTLQASCQRAPLMRLAFLRLHPTKIVAGGRE